MSRVAVVGTGYVGSTMAACMVSLGHDVVGIDVDECRVRRLNEADVETREPGLAELLRAGLRQSRLRFTVDFASIRDAEFVFLCVPTPPSEDGHADLSHMLAAARSVAPHLQPNSVVINKSTVPVGSTALVEHELARNDVHVVSNPEFLREGSAVHDCLHPDRLVIGSDDDAVAMRVFSLYRGVVAPLVATDPATAELTKYAANAFLAMKISFMNEISAICDRLGADVGDLASGLGHDRRIGAEYLRVGPGWGGSCLPKDTRALEALAAEAGHDFRLLRASIEANDDQMNRILSKVRASVGGDLRDRSIAVWGLSFKAGTPDTRESPAVRLIDLLANEGGAVRAHDPMVDPSDPNLDGIEVFDDPVKASDGAHCLVVMTEWDEYRWVDFEELASVMEGRGVIDARNHLNRDMVLAAGFDYVGVGVGR